MQRSLPILLSVLLVAASNKQPWDETNSGASLNLDGSTLVYSEEFDRPSSFNGPVYWAKQHSDIGLGTYDEPGGLAYSIVEGTLQITAYRDGKGNVRSGNVQSANFAQAYRGAKIVPGKKGFVCGGCYWEARIKFPRAYGTWGGLWLLTPDHPKNRGHLEVDGIEYYGLGDKKGHHHSWHRWDTKEKGGHIYNSNYVGMPQISDFEWHRYGIDLRGIQKINGKPALVIYTDGKEVARYAVDSVFFEKDFFYLLTLSLNPKDKKITLPQTISFDYIKAWRQ